ncbi:MAG: hypothetical protein Kow0042_15500 [Calditrichia bacterium]
MARVKIIIITLWVFIISGYSMSFFSSANQGIGMRQFITTVRGMGMGDAGITLPDRFALNGYNIASWRHADWTQVSLLMHYDRNSIDFGEDNFQTSTSNFSGVHFSVPIKKHQWVFGISVLPYTLVDFSYKKRIDAQEITYFKNVFLKGSISRVQANLAWSPHPRLGLGISYHYYYGNIEDRVEWIFDHPDYYDSSSKIEYRFGGPAAGFSLEYMLLDSLYLGGFLDLKPNLNFTEVTTDLITREEQEFSSEATLPLSFGLGGNYYLNSRWNFAASVAFQKWSEGFSLSELEEENLEDWYRMGVGIEHVHAPGGKRSFWNKIDIRAGFSMGNIGYKYNQQSVKEYSGHLGLGVPFFGDQARFDFALIAGIRGDRSQTLAQEKFFHFVLSISAGELWFQKFR